MSTPSNSAPSCKRAWAPRDAVLARTHDESPALTEPALFPKASKSSSMSSWARRKVGARQADKQPARACVCPRPPAPLRRAVARFRRLTTRSCARGPRGRPHPCHAAHARAGRVWRARARAAVRHLQQGHHSLELKGDATDLRATYTQARTRRPAKAAPAHPSSRSGGARTATRTGCAGPKPSSPARLRHAGRGALGGGGQLQTHEP